MTIKNEKNNLDKLCRLFLDAWITYPLILLVCHIVQGARGKFPTKEEILANGFSVGGITLTYTRVTSLYIFRALGIITILFVIFLFFSKKKHLYSEKMFKKKPFLYFLFGLLVWTCITTIFSDNLLYAFNGETNLGDGLSSYFIYAAVFAVAYSVQESENKKHLFRYFAISVSILSFSLILQNLKIFEFLDTIFTATGATIFNNRNHFGYYLCMGTAVSFSAYLYDQTDDKKVNFLYIITFFINYIGLVLNDTFGSWLAIMIGLPIVYVIYLYSGKPVRLSKKNAIILYVLMIVISFSLSNTVISSINTTVSDVGTIVTNGENSANAGSRRWGLWVDCVKKIKNRPVFGYGPMGLYGDYAISYGDVPHNEYLQMAAYHGIPGLVLYMTSIIMLFKHHIVNIKELASDILISTSVMGCYLISAFFGNPVCITYPFYMMFFGISAGYEILNKNSDRKKGK